MGSFSSSKNKSESQESSESFVDPFQARFLNDLRFRNQDTLNQTEGAAGFSNNLSDSLGATGNVFLDQLAQLLGGGGAVGDSVSGLQDVGGSDLFQQILSGLSGGGAGDSALARLSQPGGGGGALAGTDSLQSLADNGIGDVSGLLEQGAGVEESISLLDRVLQENLESTAGTIAGQSTLAGGTGGSRQAFATGVAGQRTQTEFRQGATDILNRDLSERRQLAPQLLQADANTRLAAGGALQSGDLGQRGLSVQQGGLELAAAQGLNQSGEVGTSQLLDLLNTQLGGLFQAGQLDLGETGAGIAGAQAGLDSLGSLFDLGIGRFAGAFSPLLAAASVLGSPTVLGRSQGSSRGTGNATRFSILDFGGGSAGGGGGG